MLLGKPGGGGDDDEPHEDAGGSDDEIDDLDPKEIVEHKHAAMESFIKAVQEGAASTALKAFETLHKLDHAAWDKEDSGGDAPPEDDEG